MDFFKFQARKTKADKQDTAATAAVPEIKIEELEARPAPIEVVEQDVSETFIGRMRADIRKFWSKDE